MKPPNRVPSVALVAVLLLSACGRADTPPSAATASRDTFEEAEGILDRRAGVPVVIDRETGCQYLDSWGHGLTPRMDSRGRGGYHQMGCHY